VSAVIPLRTPPRHAAAKRPRGRPRKTADERDEGNRRRQLVKAAARLFRRQGFDGTSTRDIAAAVGMHAGSPFYHFKSKGELLYAVMEQGMQSAITRQSAALAGGDAATRLRRLIRNHFDTLHGPGRDFIPVMLYESRALNARQRAGIATLQREYEAHWMPVLEALALDGRLKAEVHLARLLIFGALNWSVQRFDRRKRATLDEVTDAAMALFLS
jgi:AcrR family transcriptional regulator